MQAKKILPVYLLLLLFGGCAPSYVPNVTNAPLLYQKGDFIAGLYLNNTLELQSAYGVSDHLGVMVNIAALPFSENRYYLGEAGIGGYTVVGDKFHLELFGGGGLGSGKAEGTSFNSPVSEQGKYTKFFIQPDIGLHYKVFEIALAGRFTYVDYKELRRNSTDVSPAPSDWLIEPCLALRFGFGGNGFFENKKLAIHLGFSVPMDGDSEFENATLIGGVGLIYRNRKYNTNFK